MPKVVTNKTVLGSYKKGGKVKKTGLYKLHKGENVIPMKKKSMKPGEMFNKAKAKWEGSKADKSKDKKMKVKEGSKKDKAMDKKGAKSVMKKMVKKVVKKAKNKKK